MSVVQVRCHVPFCAHCAGPTGMVASKALGPSQFPLFCDGCGFVTMMLTRKAFIARMNAIGHGFPDIPDDVDGILFCEAPGAQA